jgi:hypothetical protein
MRSAIASCLVLALLPLSAADPVCAPLGCAHATDVDGDGAPDQAGFSAGAGVDQHGINAQGSADARDRSADLYAEIVEGGAPFEWVHLYGSLP